MKHTLKELKEMRTKWIEEGHEKNIFEAARLIGYHFAKLLPSDQGKAFPRLPKVAELGGGVVVHYRLVESYRGTLNAAKLEITEQVAVTVGGKKGREFISGKRVLFWEFAKREPLDDLNRFIPGKWEKILVDAYSLAEKKESEEHGEINQAKCDKLMKMLLIGQEV